MASELEVGAVQAATAELNATDYHLKLQDGAGNPWYLRAPDGSLRVHLNGTGDVLNFDGTGNITQLGGSPEYISAQPVRHTTTGESRAKRRLTVHLKLQAAQLALGQMLQAILTQHVFTLLPPPDWPVFQMA